MSKLHLENTQVQGIKERGYEAYWTYDEWTNDADDEVIGDFRM